MINAGVYQRSLQRKLQRRFLGSPRGRYGIVYLATLSDGRQYVGQTRMPLHVRIGMHLGRPHPFFRRRVSHQVSPTPFDRALRSDPGLVRWRVLCQAGCRDSLSDAEHVFIVKYGTYMPWAQKGLNAVLPRPLNVW